MRESRKEEKINWVNVKIVEEEKEKDTLLKVWNCFAQTFFFFLQMHIPFPEVSQKKMSKYNSMPKAREDDELTYLVNNNNIYYIAIWKFMKALIWYLI